MTSPAWLAYSLPLVFFSFLLFQSRSQPLLIRAPNFFSDTRVMTQGYKRTSRISIIFFNYFNGCKKPQKCVFSQGDFTFSITAQKRFGLLEKRNTRKTKTNVSSTMIYLSYGTSLITVVQVVLQITAFKY